MSPALPMITDDEFHATVLEADRPVVVDFSAAWCPPCRLLEPVVAELASEWPDVCFVELDVDPNHDTVLRYGVLSMPTLIVFRNGAEIARLVGSRSKCQLAQELEAALGKQAVAV